MGNEVFIRQYEHNCSAGPYHENEEALPKTPPETYPVRYIAYYLPQFHAFPENDAWWGKGFTEWTNVTKALPRYLGHYQPRLPGDLGFYNLSQVDAIRAQVELAKRSGVYGFCIHNYWFSGKTLLETPLEIILRNPDIDIPFCLNWANESWSRRWDGAERDILIEQKYAPGEDLKYAEYISRFVRDERYIRIGGRPVIMVYRPGEFLNMRETAERWREYFIKEGLGDPLLIHPQAAQARDPREHGLDGTAAFPPHLYGWSTPNVAPQIKPLDTTFSGLVHVYDDMIANALADKPTEFLHFPGVCPAWDNEARRTNKGVSFVGSTPAKYGDWLMAASRQAQKGPEDARIVFINAWNEWAEGAYLEPDRHFGHAYLAETRRVLDELITGKRAPRKQVDAHKASSPYESVQLRSRYSPVSILERVRKRLHRSLSGGR